MTDMKHELDAVIRNLESRPWIQGEMEQGEAVCAHGAVITCKELAPGDADIIRAVISHQGFTEGWNDIEGRTKEEVLERFRSIEVTDAALADAFGPQWAEVVALVRRAATLTEDEAEALVTARHAARITAQSAAWAVALEAARDAALVTAREATRDAARDATEDATGDAARVAAGDATQALVVRDLIGDGFTQAHYNTLTGPWASVVGKVHPDDTEELSND